MLAKVCEFLLIFAVFCITGGTLPTNNNEKHGPLWIIQMGNREQNLGSSRMMLNSQNALDFSNLNPLLINERMLDMAAQNLRNFLPLVELDGQYYYFEKYFKTNYFKAMQYCREHGMELLSIETGEEFMVIVGHLKKYYPKIEHFWTSGTDAGEEGAFVWLSTGKSLNYTNWGQGLPDNSGKIEHCLEILRYGTENYVWNDRTCTADYNFICEIRQ